MTVDIRPGRAKGVTAAPPSKSMAHRLLICAGLSDGVSHIRDVELSEDIAATIDCLRALGAVCQVDGSTVTVRGADPRKADPTAPLCCRESGSTLRFFIPLALLCGKAVTFTGTEKLLSRPLGVYQNLCDDNGFSFCQDKAQLCVRGGAFQGEFTLPGDVSSQFITGLLLALPLCQGDSVIRILPPVESRSYIQLTLQALKSFGVTATWLDENTLSIPGNQRYCPRDLAVEGDWSGAAFFYGMNALGADITVTGVDPDSLQGDKVCIAHMDALCAGCPEIDISDCPDLGPILFAVAAAKNGAKFTGTRRLKIKESDRAEATKCIKCNACIEACPFKAIVKK